VIGGVGGIKERRVDTAVEREESKLAPTAAAITRFFDAQRPTSALCDSSLARAR
jgi:hypothetical protein